MYVFLTRVVRWTVLADGAVCDDEQGPFDMDSDFALPWCFNF